MPNKLDRVRRFDVLLQIFYEIPESLTGLLPIEITQKKLVATLPIFAS